MQLDIMLTSPLTKTITFEKFGMSLRPLTDTEKATAIRRADDLYFSRKAKARIKKYIEYEDYTSDNFMVASAFIKNLTKEERKACFVYSDYLKEGNQLKKLDVKKVLNQTAIVEVTDKIDEYIEDRYQSNFVNMVIRFLIYTKTNIELTDIRKMSVSSEEFSVLQTTEIIRFTARLCNYINTKETPLLEPLFLSGEDFEKFGTFVKALSKERIRDLYIILDTLFSGNNAYENRVVFLVSVIERLLIKHDTNYDIGKQFTLKFGLLIKENTKDFTSNKYLNYCYAIRSCIVHGDDTRIMTLPKKHLKLNDEELSGFLKADTHYSQRERALLLAIVYLERQIRVALSSWVENTEKIEYLKQN